MGGRPRLRFLPTGGAPVYRKPKTQDRTMGRSHEIGDSRVRDLLGPISRALKDKVRSVQRVDLSVAPIRLLSPKVSYRSIR